MKNYSSIATRVVGARTDKSIGTNSVSYGWRGAKSRKNRCLGASRDFLRGLFESFPFKSPPDRRALNQFLHKTKGLAIAARSHHFLALRYGVSVDTIEQALAVIREAVTTSMPH